MNKRPKFFCENCNAEVRRDAMICPHCGRFFASVRCPSCGYTGTHKEFKNGCPDCGYAFDSGESQMPNNGAHTKKAAKRKTFRRRSPTKRIHTDADPLPLWIYGLVFLLAAMLCAIFFYIM